VSRSAAGIAFTAHGLARDFTKTMLSQRRQMNIGRLSPAFPVTPPDMRVRIRRFGGLSYRPPVNLGIPIESK
jgi:hypothetical protein